MKFTGRYTAATAKALKGSPRLVCQVTEDGTIYVCNGFLLCTMNPPEYAATVQGFTCCEPGNWTLDKDGKHEDDAHKLDLVRLYADTLKANADAQPLQRSPLTVQTPKAAAVCYYNAAADFAAIYDTKFIAALHPAAQLRTTSAISAAVAYCDDEPFAVVMPIKAEPETVRAVRAFFTEADWNNAKTGEADKLRAELAQSQEEAATLRGDLYRAANEIDELKNKLAELHETKTEQPAEQKPEPKTAAEITVARYFLNQIMGDFKEMKKLLPNTELDRITLENEKEAFLKGESMETYIIRSITTLDREQYAGDNEAFSYPNAETRARQENLKDYAVIHVEFYQKWNDKAESHAPQWNSGECGRNFLVGKKALDKNYKIYDFGMMM